MYIWNVYIQVSFHICRSLFIYVGLFFISEDLLMYIWNVYIPASFHICRSLFIYVGLFFISEGFFWKSDLYKLWMRARIINIVWHGMSRSMSHYRHVTLNKWGVHEPHAYVRVSSHVTPYTDLWMTRLLSIAWHGMTLYIVYRVWHGMRLIHMCVICYIQICVPLIYWV